MKPDIAVSAFAFAWLGRASYGVVNTIDHVWLNTRSVESPLHVIQARTVETRSRSAAAGSAGSPKTPKQANAIDKSSKGISKPNRSSQDQSPRSVSKRRKSSPEAGSPTWAKYATHGGSTVYLADHNTPLADSDAGWRGVSRGDRKSDRIVSPIRASTSVVPDIGNRNMHHTAAAGQRVGAWLANRNGNGNGVVQVEASGPGYETIRHTVSPEEGSMHRQYRAGSPSRPVTVKTSYQAPSDAYLEAMNPGSPGYNKRIPAHQIFNMQNAE